MDRQKIFRDYQEEVAADHNDLQNFVRSAIDNLALDAISSVRKYSGLTVTKTGQVEVTISAGRVYEAGVSYSKREILTQSLATYAAAAAKRIVTVSAYGQEVETDVQTRDYLTNVDTNQVEPRAAAMTRSRDVQIVFTAGAEATEPVPAAIPATHVAVAYITLDTTQVVSVTMVEANKVVSTDELDLRADLLEAFRAAVEPRVNSLASDLADLATRISSLGSSNALFRVMEDVARVKESLRYPPSSSGYGADFYLIPDESDITNASALGYDAKLEEGVRFPDANADQFEISLFSANDPNASLISGILLPKFTDELKISTGPFSSELGIAQYGFQTHAMKQGYMSRSRIRYGGGRTVCSNGVNWDVTPGQPAVQGLYDYATTQITTSDTVYVDIYNQNHYANRFETYWFDTWQEPFMYTVTTDLSIVGAQVAQTFLVSNDIIATKLGFYITAKGASEDVNIVLCEVSQGQPDLNKVMGKFVYPHASIVTGMNRFSITPTFLQKGKRYALVFISNANHKIGMTSGQSYLDGTFFYSTDGIYFQGDLTKDFMIEVWGAKFGSAQVAIEFAPINLDGGFRDIDILAEMWAPASTQLVFEIRPNGSGEWQPLVKDNAGILATAPPLAQFRARFVGTSDMQPMIHLIGSRVIISRPKTALKHISTPITCPALPGTANNVTVKVLLEGYDETPNDHSMTLRVGSSNLSPVSVVTKLLDITAKRYQRTYTFSAAGGTTSFRIIQDGATTSPQLTYHVAERVYYTS
jgi:hypothetical protein